MPVRERIKVAGFEQIARSHTNERSAPSEIRLPASLVRALDEAWRDSNPHEADQIEQGGNLVRTSGGSYKVRRGHGHNDQDTYDPDYDDVGFGETFVGIVHTHPYLQNGYDYGTFSDVDMANLVDQDQPLNVLRSGSQTYIISRTREFDAIVERHEKADTLFELRRAIIDTYEHAFKAEKQAGLGFPAQLEAGVKAVCRAFHLIYYWGQGQDLQRVK